MDFRPSRMGVVANCVEAFVREFFDQNPLSHLGIITLHNGVAQCLTDLSGSPETHIRALRANLECAGDASIQNAIDLARGLLCQIPTYAHRETLLIFSALSTCDPGDILEAVRRCKDANIRCSVVGLAAEIYICKLLCEQTGGNYSVATSEVSIMSFAPCDPLTFCSVYCVRHWCLMDFFIIHQSVVYSIT